MSSFVERIESLIKYVENQVNIQDDHYLNTEQPTQPSEKSNKENQSSAAVEDSKSNDMINPADTGTSEKESKNDNDNKQDKDNDEDYVSQVEKQLDSIVVVDNSDRLDEILDKIEKGKCAIGYFTEKGKQLWIEHHIKSKNLSMPDNIDSLYYDKDRSKPLYFWQLYSLLGKDRIENILKEFYKSVFNDSNIKEYNWFAKEFITTSADIKYHVQKQSEFWLDCFGAGRQYYGGEFRLHYHHRRNAFPLMNENGAKRWMYHMCKVLNDKNIDLTDDPRVKSTIFSFLHILVVKYANDFNFEIDQVPFE